MKPTYHMKPDHSHILGCINFNYCVRYMFDPADELHKCYNIRGIFFFFVEDESESKARKKR